MMHWNKIFYLPIFCLSNPCWALTLDDTIVKALQYEGQLQLTGLKVEQKQANVLQAKRSYGPNVHLVGQLGYEKIVTHQGTMFPSEGSRALRGLELQFDYPVYTWGRYQLGIQAAELQKNAQIEALSGQRAKTILQTVSVYTDVLKQEALLQLQIKTNENLKRSLFEAEKRFAVGLITRADLAQVKAQYAQGQADYVSAQSNLKISQLNFYQITGVEATALESIKKLPVLENDLIYSLSQIEKHPILNQARYELEAAQKQYELVRKELKPMVNLTSRIGTQHDLNSMHSQSENYMFGIQVNMPIYDHGINKANIQKADVDRKLARQQLDILKLDVDRNIRQFYAQLDAIRENKQAIQDAIDSASIALQYIQKELDVGTKTTFDLLTAQQKLLELQTQQVIHQQDEVLLIYQIFDQTGQIEKSLKIDAG